MTFTVESKSQLARLLATENLTIEHQKISTAKFDPKNRVLYCPIWQNMSGALYDLLMGHEVGHALYTPTEGWHDAVSNKGRNFKGFLNVVEDARIEKKIKRRYPGIRKSFIDGYTNLLARDFFGINNKDVNDLSFIDRLNIYTKSGGLTKIDFDAEETKLVEQVEACETWEDVLRVTEAVFDYSKDEQFETFKLNVHQFSFDADDEDLDGEELDDNEFSDYDDESEYDDEPEAGDQNIGEKRDTDSEGEDGEKELTDNSDSKGDEGQKGTDQGKQFNPIKESKLSEQDQYDNFEPTCDTDNSFRQNETALLDEKCKPFVYPVIPKVIMKNIMTPASVVHKALEKYKDSEYLSARAETLVKDFKNKNDRYVSLLAKEFEMKKAARAYAKSKTANTGDIDINKLYKYQVDDNIFKKMQRVPKGKSHGLVLLLDRSGSMSRNMAGSIEQILVLTQFCRKVNIPFVVYGFGDSGDGRMSDFPGEKIEKGFSADLGELALGHVFLREYINSRMNNAEYNRCLKNMVALKASYEGQFNCRPANEHLSNTPLIQAMVALEPLTKEFRQKNNLDLVNLVIVHDGDADNVNARIEEKTGYDNETYIGGSYFDISSTNVYIKDRNSKLQVKIGSEPHKYWSYNDGMRVAIFDWYRATTGAKIFGFFIAGEGREIRQQLTAKYIDKDGKSVYENIDKIYNLGNNNRYFEYDKCEYVKALVSQVKKDKFIQSYNKGYDSFFIMPGGSDLKVEDEELEIEGKVTASKLKNAFMKLNKKKQVNRVMVSRFIDGIAA